MIKLGLTEVSLSLGVRQLATWCYSVVEYVGRGSDLEARASRDWSLDLLLTSCVINTAGLLTSLCFRMLIFQSQSLD